MKWRLSALNRSGGKDGRRGTDAPDHVRADERDLAEENEWDEDKKIFQAHEQSGIVPDAARGEEDGGGDEQDFVKFKRAEVENELGNFAGEQIAIDRESIHAEEQERGADEIERIANQESFRPIGKWLRLRMFRRRGLRQE